MIFYLHWLLILDIKFWASESRFLLYIVSTGFSSTQLPALCFLSRRDCFEDFVCCRVSLNDTNAFVSLISDFRKFCVELNPDFENLILLKRLRSGFVCSLYNDLAIDVSYNKFNLRLFASNTRYTTFKLNNSYHLWMNFWQEKQSNHSLWLNSAYF